MTAATNEPVEVTRHLRVWASPAHEEAEAGPLDVCLLPDGTAVVWDPDVDGLAGRGACWTWDDAVAEARVMADARATLVRERWVRVMCDFSAEPLWQRNGCMASVEDLPVDADLRDRLRRWAATFEHHDGFFHPDDGAVTDPVALARFAAEGLAIAKALKAALPDWTVVYHDESGHRTDEDAPRSAWEYEIILDTRIAT